MAGSGVLRLRREAWEQAVRGGGRGAEASLRGFAAGYEIAAGSRPAPAPAPPPRRATELNDVIQLGISRLTDYQGAAYARLFEERLKPFVAGDAQLAAEVARPLPPGVGLGGII